MFQFFSCFLLLLPFVVFGKPIEVKLNAKAAILMNADNGKVIFAKNPNRAHPPASMTKLLSALVFLNEYNGSLDTLIKADKKMLGAISEKKKIDSNYSYPSYYIEFNSSHIGIKAGELLSVSDLLQAMLIATANDASNIIANYLTGSIDQFIDKMNHYQKNLGCKYSNFTNPHGLHHPEQVTSAKDFAIIALEALKNPIVMEYVRKTHFKRPKTNLQAQTTYAQTNLLLRKGKYKYEPALGLKTGTTKIAGRNIVAYAEKNGRKLIAVILGGKTNHDRYHGVTKLFEEAFNEPKVKRKVLAKGSQKFSKKVANGRGAMQAYLDSDLSIDYYPSERPNVKAYIDWDETVVAPIKKRRCDWRGSSYFGWCNCS